MRVFVQRYSAAGVQPQCFPIEIDTNGPINAAALKDIIASQLDQSLQDEVLAHRGMLLRDDADITSIHHASSSQTAVVQLLRKPKPPHPARTAEPCTCGSSKFKLTPVLPDLRQVIADNDEGLMALASFILTPSFSDSWLKCRACVDEDLAAAVLEFCDWCVELSNPANIQKDVNILQHETRRSDEVWAVFKSFLEYQLTRAYPAWSRLCVSSNPMTVESCKELLRVERCSTIQAYLARATGHPAFNPAPISGEFISQAIAHATAQSHQQSFPSAFSAPNQSAAAASLSATPPNTWPPVMTSSSLASTSASSSTSATPAAMSQGSSLTTPLPSMAAGAGATAVASAAPPHGLPNAVRVAVPNVAATASSAPSTGLSPAASGGVSADMFQQALSHAMATPSQAAHGPRQTHASSHSHSQPRRGHSTASGQQRRHQQPRPSDGLRARYTNELTMMQLMGMENDRINLEALIATDGDVNLACNLVLSGSLT